MNSKLNKFIKRIYILIIFFMLSIVWIAYQYDYTNIEFFINVFTLTSIMGLSYIVVDVIFDFIDKIIKN